MRKPLNTKYSAELVGRRLRQLRISKNLDQRRLAEKLKVSRTCISNWEHGRRLPDVQSVKLLCRIFHVPADYIYGMSKHKYNVKIPDYFEIDFTKLNDDGMIALYKFYKYLKNSPEYRAVYSESEK